MRGLDLLSGVGGSQYRLPLSGCACCSIVLGSAFTVVLDTLWVLTTSQV